MPEDHSPEYMHLVHQLDVLCEINREINSRLEMKPLLDSIAESTARLLDADAVSVMLYDERMHYFKTIAGWKSWSMDEPAVVFSDHEGIVGKVASTRQGMLVANASDSPDFKPTSASRGPTIKSLMCVPLIVKMEGEEKLLGVINTSRRHLTDKPEKDSFSQKDIQLFEKFSDQVTAAIERSHVFEEIRHRTLQLQIVNDISKILSSSLQKSKNFQKALTFLTDKLKLSFGQMLVMRQKELLFNFNTKNDKTFLPAPVSALISTGRISKKSRLVLSHSHSRSVYPLESGGMRSGYLYLESPDPFFFDDEDNVLVLETVRDQIMISLENFLLFQEIHQSKQKLENLNKMKNELISIVSHDFRNPLTVIHAYSELLLIRPNLDHETREEYLNSIFAQIGHLRRLADGALKISRIESGEMTYFREKIHFQSLVDKFAVKQLPHHRIRFVGAADLPPMWSDFDRLFEILDNLISNAVKYSPEGGDIVVQAKQKGEFMEIRVKDKGIGIAADQVGKLFQKYYRVYDEKTKHIRGTGLGLYICRKMVEELGGKIGVRSKPGAGATFYFTMPLYRENMEDGDVLNQDI